jgi:hypothetical protein
MNFTNDLEWIVGSDGAAAILVAELNGTQTKGVEWEGG